MRCRTWIYSYENYRNTRYHFMYNTMNIQNKWDKNLQLLAMYTVCPTPQRMYKCVFCFDFVVVISLVLHRFLYLIHPYIFQRCLTDTGSPAPVKYPWKICCTKPQRAAQCTNRTHSNCILFHLAHYWLDKNLVITLWWYVVVMFGCFLRIHQLSYSIFYIWMVIQT